MLAKLEPWILRLTVTTAFVITIVSGWRSLHIQHASGDQRVYAGIAMKIGAAGPKPSAYNLRGIGMRPQNEALVYYAQSGGRGDLLRKMASEGVAFYDQPLFHAPPLYPALLSLSHGLLASGREYSVLFRNEHEPGLGLLWRTQGWAVFPTFVFTLLWLWVAYLLGREFGGAWMGAGTILLLACSPAFLLVSQRLWADALLGLCMTACVWAYLRANGRDRLALTGLFFGLALLTKNSALLLLLPLVAGSFVSLPGGGWGALLRVLAVALVLTALWYFQTVRHFGTPFFNVDSAGIAQRHPWFQFINSRPWYSYLLGTPFQNPVFAMAMIGLPILLRRRERRLWPLLAWAFGSLVLLTISVQSSEMLGPDHRYLLPMYPAFAILALSAAQRIALRCRPGPARLVLGLIVLWSATWSLQFWYSLRDGDLLAEPF